MPYINRPYRNRPKFLDYISRYIDPEEDIPPATDFTVELAPFPIYFLENGQAIFPISKRKDAIRISKREIKPDTVIYATGYKQDFSIFEPRDNYGNPTEADIRNISKAGDETVGFIGFVRPGVGKLHASCLVRCLLLTLRLGAIPPIAEMQAFFWVELIKGRIKKPLTPPHYHLLVGEKARLNYAVNHGAYMSTLAKDIGAAPGLVDLWWQYGTQVVICYWCVLLADTCANIQTHSPP